MNAAHDLTDSRLAPADIEQITGIPPERYMAQRNRLRKFGIKAEVNARREVVCFWSWVAAAALPVSAGARYIQAPPANEDLDDIGMNLDALHRAKAQKA